MARNACVVPDHRNAPGPEECHHVHKLLELRAGARRDGSITMRGNIGRRESVCHIYAVSHQGSIAGDAAGRSNRLSGCNMRVLKTV